MHKFGAELGIVRLYDNLNHFSQTDKLQILYVNPQILILKMKNFFLIYTLTICKFINKAKILYIV